MKEWLIFKVRNQLRTPTQSSDMNLLSTCGMRLEEGFANTILKIKNSAKLQERNEVTKKLVHRMQKRLL